MQRKAGLFAVVLVACSLAGGRAQSKPEPIYDLLLKNGNVLDPASNRQGRFDIAIVGDRVARIAPGLAAHQARTVVDVSAYYVTPGLIDLHAYVNAQAVYRQGDPRTDWRNVNPDHNALRHGVTTVVDGGSTGWKNFAKFKELIIDRSQVRLLAFLNIVGNGMTDGESVVSAADLQIEETVEAARRQPQTIVGVRSPHLKGAGREGIDRTIRAAESIKGAALVEYLAEDDLDYRDLLQRLRPGDLITHTFAATTPMLEANGAISSTVSDARRRGVLFDLGHGSQGFAFRIAVPAVRKGFLPDIISTAMDKTSLLLPRAEMMTTLSKLLNLGVPLEGLVERATARPAKAINRPELGTLREGGVADIAVIELQQGRFAFLDSGNARLRGDRRLRAVLTVRAGRVVWDSEGLSTGDWTTAGPYTNYR